MISFRKVFAIMDAKTKTLMSKNFFLMMLFSIGYGILMNSVIGEVTTYALALAVVCNVGMALYITTLILAEEKEKNTLRVLMTSSVTGIEYFLGTVIPILIELEIVNLILVIVLGVQMSLTAWIIYILMTTLATLSCAMIGMIFGIYAKNQMNANSVVTPAVLILMLIPMFADLMPIMAILSNYLFTGVVIESINSLTYNSIIVTPMQWTVLLIECVLSIIALLFLYKKNGFEA